MTSLLLTALVSAQFGPGRLIGPEARLASGRTSARIFDSGIGQGASGRGVQRSPEPPIAAGALDHSPLFGGFGSYTMLAPQRERWAVASLESVGPEKVWTRVPDREGRDQGSWNVFDVELRVLDGWNVERGSLQAFWEQDASRRRRGTLARMVGTRVLVRLAPTEDGHSVWVSGREEAPTVSPAYAIHPERAFIDRMLPTRATALPKGPPDARRWYALWEAATSLSPSAYEPFAGAVSIAKMPETPEFSEPSPLGGGADPDGRPGLSDVRWLQTLAQRQNPEFGMMVADYLGRREIAGSQATMRGLVRQALRDPGAFPDGVFRVADPRFLNDRFDPKDPHWPPVDAIAKVIPTARNPMLSVDLLGLLTSDRYLLPQERGGLVPLLTDSDLQVRRAALAAFAVWQGTPPKDADPVAWHAARARLSREALAAAKAASGG